MLSQSYLDVIRSSRLQMFFKISILKKFLKLYSKTSVVEFLFNKVATLKGCNFVKKKLRQTLTKTKLCRLFSFKIIAARSGPILHK